MCLSVSQSVSQSVSSQSVSQSVRPSVRPSVSSQSAKKEHAVDDGSDQMAGWLAVGLQLCMKKFMHKYGLKSMTTAKMESTLCRTVDSKMRLKKLKKADEEDCKKIEAAQKGLDTQFRSVARICPKLRIETFWAASNMAAFFHKTSTRVRK